MKTKPTPQQIELAKRMIEAGITREIAARTIGVCAVTLNKHLKCYDSST